jgi:hypothetical protein
MLLHLWIIVLFGTTTQGSFRRDRDFGDALDVTLRALTEERGPGFRLAPGIDSVSPGTALLPRKGAAVPAARGRDLARPGDTPSPQPSTDTNERGSAPPEPPSESPPPATAAPIAPPAVEVLPRLNLDAPEVVDKPYVPVAPPVERELAPPAPTAPREIAPPAPVERIVAPPVERESSPAAETKSPDAPRPPAAPSKPLDIPAPPPIERVIPSTVEREIAPPPEAKPREVPIAPAPPSEPVPAPKIEARPAPPVSAPPPMIPSEPAARPEPPTTSTPRELAPPAAAPAATPTPRNVPSDVPLRPAERTAPERAPEVRPPGRTDTAPAESPPRLRFGAPEPDEDMFKPRRDTVTPPAEPGAAPRLDLDDAKKRAARAIVREGSGSRSLLPIVPPPPERESKEARALEKAAKPDCRNAYANMGLLATVPLVASAIGDGGCRW